MLRSQRLQYHAQDYHEWSQIPPNLPLPSTANVSVLELTFERLVYLNQINTNGQVLELKLEWWGMEQPHTLIYDEVRTCQGKYVLCCSIERLLSYFNDMKLLSIDLTNKFRGIGKAYLNFLVLRGWRGEDYSGLLDIKHNGKKIGELSYRIEIKAIENPFINKPERIEERKLTNIQIKTNQPSVEDVLRKTSIPVNQETLKRLEEVPKFKTASNTTNRLKSQQDRIDSQPSKRTSKPEFCSSTNKLEILREQPIFRQSNEAKYQTELIRLVQDYNLLFERRTHSITRRSNSENSIEIEIMRIQLNQKDAPQVEVVVPLVDGNRNYYRLAVGGFIKLQLSDEVSQQELINYLKECNLTFRQGEKIEGAIKLSKILAKSNEMMEIQLFEKETKREARKHKGSCWVRAIPPASKESPTSEQLPKQIDEPPQVVPQVVKPKQEEYVLLNLKNYNSIEKNNRIYNLFIKIYSDQDVLGETRTLWNTSLTCSFEEKVTCKIQSNKLRFELNDRQQTVIKLASGELIMNSPLGINLQVPLTTKSLNNRTVVGYISLDFFRNGLESVTKMVGVLNHQKELSKTQEKREVKEKENIIDELNIEQRKKEPQILDYEEHEEEISRPEEERVPQQVLQQRKPARGEAKLSIMQIYNKIFTYLHDHHEIMQNLSSKNDHRVTQFISILEPLVSRSIISNSQLNQLVSHYLHQSLNMSNINQVNTTAFRDSYEAFSTYYEQIIQEKDEILQTFLEILEGMGMGINDLEYQLRSDKKIWPKLNQILASHKGNSINIVENIKKYYQRQDQNYPKYGIIDEITGARFCDVLRKFEVYETTLGSEVNEDLLCERIYSNTVELLEEVEPNVREYSYKQLMAFLEEEQIILSSWELLNLKEYLGDYSHKTVPKYKNYNQFPFNSDPSTQFKEFQPAKEQTNRATISKSPTFGFLHQPELLKPQILTSGDYMEDSLATKMQNLAISPINYNSNQTVQNQAYATFSNLTHPLFDLYVNDIRVSLDSYDSITPNNYRSNSANEQEPSKANYSSKEPLERDLSELSPKPSEPHQLRQQFKSQSLEKSIANLVLRLQNIQKAFSYKVQLHFQQLQEVIELDCLHGQWVALVSEQGRYLGGVLIN